MALKLFASRCGSAVVFVLMAGCRGASNDDDDSQSSGNVESISSTSTGSEGEGGSGEALGGVEGETGGVTNSSGTSDGGANTIDAKDPDASKGAGGNAQCPPFEACGGDPVGNWSFAGLCFLPDPPIRCPEMAVTGSGTVEGTYSVSSQQTTARVAIEATLQVTLPISCLDEVPCSDAFVGFGSSVGATVVAVESSGFCAVTITQPRHENEITRSITIGETEFVDEVQRETAFCQDVDQLRIKELSDNLFGIVYTLQRQ